MLTSEWQSSCRTAIKWQAETKDYTAWRRVDSIQMREGRDRYANVEKSRGDESKMAPSYDRGERSGWQS
jgi:hypothetical protein